MDEIDPTTGLPQPLARLLARCIERIDIVTYALKNGQIDTASWQGAMQEILAEYHQAAYMVGAGEPQMTQLSLPVITADVQAEFAFLDNFRIVIEGAAQFEPRWAARARQYAGGIKRQYWRGRVKMLPLPAMPAEGTQCNGNCGCLWDIVVVDESAGDYDCYWVRGKEDSCQTCIQRAADWSPLRIRGGFLEG